MAGRTSTGKAARRRGSLIAGIVGAIFAYSAVPPAGGEPAFETAARGAEEPRRTLLTSEGLTVRAELGPSCLYGRPVGQEPRNILCTDKFYNPGPGRAALPVRGGGRLVVTTGAAAKYVRVSYEKPNRDGTGPVVVFRGGRARRADRAGLRWKTRLPKRVRAARNVVVGVKFRDGAIASFGTRISTGARCGRTQ